MSRNKRQWRSQTPSRAGVVLVVVLWVMVVLAVLAVALAQNTQLDNAVRMAAGDRVTARWLARAGVYQAIGEIAHDKSPTDWSGDSWHNDEKLFYQVSFPGGTFTTYADRFYPGNRCAYGAVDEASKINLNTATLQMLLALPEMTESLASAIIERRGGGQDTTITSEQSHPDQEPAGGQFLDMGRIRTVRALGWLAEVTNQTLYGEDDNLNGILEDNENDGDESPPTDDKDGILDRGLLAYVTVYSYELNRDGQDRNRININTADQEELEFELGLLPEYAHWIIENRPYNNSIAELLADEDQVTGAQEAGGTAGAGAEEGSIRPDIDVFRQIADHITITDAEVIPGRVNINTAGVVVLQSLPGINEQLAESILESRRSRAEGFSSIAELLTVPGMTINQFKKAAPLITVRSNVFTIRSCGQAARTGIKHSIEAVVSRGRGEPIILYWKEKT